MKYVKLFRNFNQNKLYLKILALILSSTIRILKNIIPPKYELNNKLHLLQTYINLFTYNYRTVTDYCHEKGISVKSEDTDIGKVFLMKDFYINVFEFGTIIHDNHNNVIAESILYQGKNETCEYYRKGFNFNRVKNVKYIDEAVSLAFLWINNYWHFTFQALDKVAHFEKNGYTGKYIVFDKPFIHQIFKLIDIPEERIIFINENEKYKIGKLHIIENFWKTNVPLLIEIKNKILSKIDLSESEKYPKKIYIRRIGNYSRQVTNENEVLEILNKYGFQVIYPDDYSVEDQIKYFNSAEIVVAPHGACSTNALYMKPKSHFVECFSYTWLRPCMLDIIKPNNMYYHMVVEREKRDYFCIASEPKRTRNYEINLSCLDDTIYQFV